MDHQVTFQGRTCCSAAGKVASKELPAVSSSGSALPAESHLTWSYVHPWQPASSHWAKQATLSPVLLTTLAKAMSGLNQLHFSLGPILLSSRLYSKRHAPQTLSQCPIPEATMCNIRLFHYILSCSIYHKSQKNACVYLFSGIIMILKNILFRF